MHDLKTFLNLRVYAALSLMLRPKQRIFVFRSFFFSVSKILLESVDSANNVWCHKCFVESFLQSYGSVLANFVYSLVLFRSFPGW